MESRGQNDERLALVTGGNRGIGFEVCRQLAGLGMTVILGARDPAKGDAAARALVAEDLDVLFRPFDVADEASVRALAAEIERDFGRLDVLVNNAAIHYDGWQQVLTTDLAIAHEALETNLFGPWRACIAFLPLLRRSGHGRIVNVSSEAGSFNAAGGLAAGGDRLPAYAVSKAALNALTVKLAAGLAGTGVLVNAVCPGSTATYEGAVSGRPVAEGAAGIVWAATLPDHGPSGGFFRDGRPLPW
jgi:NAD(P)-dependent dehydrogenase (short-subunit alcohol dehydrogenase family)